MQATTKQMTFANIKTKNQHVMSTNFTLLSFKFNLDNLIFINRLSFLTCCLYTKHCPTVVTLTLMGGSVLRTNADTCQIVVNSLAHNHC